MAISVRYPFSGTFQVTQTSTGAFSHTDDLTNDVDPDYWVAAYDFGLHVGIPILSMAPGIVIDYRQAGEPSHGLGSFVTILHNPGTSDEFYATYAHLSANSVLFQSSDRGVAQVAAGERIGLSGDTGVGTGLGDPGTDGGQQEYDVLRLIAPRLITGGGG
ncbi:MAG: M23 family metallopeptidase, partial [Pseudomonadota bacterium]